MSRLARIALILLALPGALAAQATTAAPPIRLVVHLAVDQFRPDYLARWADELHGGLGRLLRGGVVYLHGEQDHAITETAPGHASMLSGRWPWRTGIISNARGVGDPSEPLVGGGGPGASPHRFRGTTLYDWMRAADPAVRALSVSRKDRGAILPAGASRIPVYWYAGGRFTTSRYYADTLPTWLQAWNAKDPAAALAGTAWTPLRDVNFPEQDGRPFETGGRDATFPHPIPAERDRAASALPGFPVMDSLTLDVAWAGTRALGLGQRGAGHPDLLMISLSTTDAVGHTWGPGSLEMHDQVLRLDRYLGAFFDSLATVVPPAQMIVTLTADHGVQEYPEAGGGSRISIDDDVRALERWGASRFAIDIDAEDEAGLVMVDTDALRARGVDIARLADSIAATMRGRPGVRRVFTPSSLAAAADTEAMRWRHQIRPGTGWLVGVAVEPGWVWGTGTSSTSHGTTNLLDRRVPIIVMAPGVAPHRVDRVVGVVDIAPTIAALIGISPTEPLDGTPLGEVVPVPR